MTTEDDFHKALDASPDDWQTRLVFADWLQERGDSRAEGYRALAVNRLSVADTISRGGATKWLPHNPTCWFLGNGEVAAEERWLLPPDWFKALSQPPDDDGMWTREYPNARAAEDDAARAFGKLPAKRRAVLLTPPGPRKAPKRSARKPRKPAAKKAAAPKAKKKGK